jgi:competence protein ComEC
MTLKIFIHNVGHGQAIHAITPSGKTIVIDLGSSSNFSPLEWLKRETATIDSLVITHPHGDHIDEFLLLKKMGFNIRQLWRPNWIPKDEIRKQNQSSFTNKLDAYFDMSDQYCIGIDKNENVDNSAVNGGVTIEKFFSSDCAYSNINNHSGVVVFKYQGVTVVIPGDNEPASWNALMKQPAFVTAISNAHIFMASHHGRESGYCSDIFVSKPLLCIVSDGRVQDTDARHRYTYHAKNLTVKSRTRNLHEERACLTTRNDGHIKIEIGANQKGGTGYLAVEID